MYRQMSRQMPVPEIYCARDQWCDLECGKFHHYNRKVLFPKKQQQQHRVRDIVCAIETASIETGGKDDDTEMDTTILPSKLKENRPKLTVQTKPSAAASAMENCAVPDARGTNLHGTAITTIISLEQSSPVPANCATSTSIPNGAGGGRLPLSLDLPPVSPQPAASPASQASTVTTTVTLEDIIASARRKISTEYQEIRLPSPVFLDEEDNTLWDKRAAKKRLLFHESSLDIPAIEMEGGVADGVARMDPLHQYEDQESEAELVIQEEPPSFIDEDETADFEEMIKATKPPSDSYSNSILLRDSDPLTTRKKHHQYRNKKMLPRQQSMSRIQQLGGGNALSHSQSQRSTPSGGRTELEDTADNSSIDLSMTELSTAVAGSTGGKSPHSGALSPFSILQFIEEQKQRAAAATDDGNEP